MQSEKSFSGHGWVALILFVALLADGTLTQLFAQFIMKPTFTAVPQLTLLALVMITLFLPEERYIVPIAAVTGLIFDSFYTGMLGIMALIWPLLIYILHSLRDNVPHSPLYVGAVVVITLTADEFAEYAMSRFIGYGTTNVTTLIASHLGPGLLINIVIFALGYLPLSRLLINLNRS